MGVKNDLFTNLNTFMVKYQDKVVLFHDSTKRAIIYDPMTFGYRVMSKSNSIKWPSWIWQIFKK